MKRITREEAHKKHKKHSSKEMTVLGKTRWNALMIWQTESAIVGTSTAYDIAHSTKNSKGKKKVVSIHIKN